MQPDIISSLVTYKQICTCPLMIYTLLFFYFKSFVEIIRDQIQDILNKE